ncbi:hypothetical protein MBLNU457_4629t2 [Dothideomycetes sp. NU457]
MRPSIEVHKHIHIDAEGRTLRSERPYFIRRHSPHQEQHQSQYQPHHQPHDPDHSHARIIQYQYHSTTGPSTHSAKPHASPYAHAHAQPQHAQGMSQHYTALSGQDIHTLRTIPQHLHKVETDIHGLKHGNYNHELRIRALEKEKRRSDRKKEKEKEKEVERLLKRERERERERAKERDVQRLLREQGARRVQVEYLYPSRQDEDVVDELARARYRRQIEMLAAVERERLREMRLDEVVERMKHDGRTSRERVYGYASW